MVDKVKPLKIESSATGGTEDDFSPTEADPTEDYLGVKGIALENLDTHRIERSGNDILFVDPTVGSISADDAQSTARVSSNDTTPNYLLSKLVAGAGILITEQNDGGNETLEFSSVLSSEFEYTNDETESSTTSTTYQEKLKLTTGSLVAGDYYIGVSYQAKNQIGEIKKMDVRLELDDTTTLNEEMIRDTGNTFSLRSAFVVTTLTAGVHEVDVDFKSVTGTASIANVRIVLWRVA